MIWICPGCVPLRYKELSHSTYFLWYSYIYHKERQLLSTLDNYNFYCLLLTSFLPKFPGAGSREKEPVIIPSLALTLQSHHSAICWELALQHITSREPTLPVQSQKHKKKKSLGKPRDIPFTEALNNSILSIKPAALIFPSAPSSCESLISAPQ